MNRGEARMLASGASLLFVLAGFGLAKLLERRSRAWPKTWATIRSADIEVMELSEKTDIVLPCFTFSYSVADQDYSGRFSLFTDGKEEGELMTKKMTGRRFEVKYDPKCPSIWYIPDKRMEGYEVEQKGSPHLTESLYPKD
jgi:hypothetical protein